LTTAIVICAGEATRWGNYLNSPKQLIEIEGERILDRTVRLLRKHTDTVFVVSKPGDLRYESPGATRVDARLDPSNADADKFLSSRHLWSETSRTLIVYGDCWFDEDAVATFFEDRPDWTLYCRFGGSEITGARSGECWAVGFHPQHHAEYESALHRVAGLWRAGKLKRCGGWETYRAMNGIPDGALRMHRRYGRHVEVADGWNEDFDKPHHYDDWMARRAAAFGECGPSVSVLVPWRPDGGHRDRAWKWVRQQYAARFPQWEIVEGWPPQGPWNKALAVADALRRSQGDILVIADADCWTDGIGQAVTAVRAGSGWAVPHGKVRRLTEAATAAVIAGTPPTDALGGLAKQPYRGVEGGGLVVLPRHLYERVPLDPRFHGWGSEDRSWGYALTALAGRPWRGVAPLVHLWHEPAPRINGYVGSRDGRALEVRYEYALKDGPAAMRALVGEITAVPA
jgi:hypothetical protein